MLHWQICEIPALLFLSQALHIYSLCKVLYGEKPTRPWLMCFLSYSKWQKRRQINACIVVSVVSCKLHSHVCPQAKHAVGWTSHLVTMLIAHSNVSYSVLYHGLFIAIYIELW